MSVGKSELHTVLEVGDLSVRRGRSVIVKDISFRVLAGEFVAILGGSGSGKSTMLNALSGMIPSAGGSVAMFGQLLGQNPWLARRIGYVSQNSTVHASLRLRAALWYAGKLRVSEGIPRHELNQRVSDTLTRVGLAHRARNRIRTLSGGEDRRANIGCELMFGPPMLLLDEPTSGLDPGKEYQMMALFRGLADDGQTVLCITHATENVSLCHLILILSHGRLCFFGPPDDALTHFGFEKFGSAFYLWLEGLDAGQANELADAFPQTRWYKDYCLARQWKPTPSMDPEMNGPHLAKRPTCPRGHPLPPSAAYCPHCGVELKSARGHQPQPAGGP